MTEPLIWALFRREKKGRYSVRSRIIKEREGLHVFTPPLLFPKYIDLFTAINWRIVARIISRYVDELEMEEPILWLSNPLQAGLAEYLDGNRLVYDIMDAYRFFYPSVARKSVSRFERNILQKANAIFVSSEALAPELPENKGRITLVPNAAETKHFNPALVGSEIESDIMVIPRPRIGFMGYIGRWLDIDAIEYAACNHPEWQFVMVGPVHISLDRLERLRNVHILGLRPYEILPRIIQGFDVCLVPFREDRLLKYIDAIKVYEYLAMGKPVVAYNYEGTAGLVGLCALFSSREEMVQAIERELAAGDDTEKCLARREFAVANSWDKRCEKIEEALLALE